VFELKTRSISIALTLSFVTVLSCNPGVDKNSSELQSGTLSARTIGAGSVRAWGADALWDDGLAEVAIYETERIQYGKLRRFESAFITVKEDFNKKYYVKADWPFDGKKVLPILKLNIAFVMPTENYDYHHLVSVFVDRNNVLRPVKMTVGSQEWCGNTFKEFKNWGPRPQLTYHSYFEGDSGDGTYEIDFTEADLLDEQLFLSLRSLPFEPGFTLKTRIMDAQISNRAREPKLTGAKIVVVGEESVESGIGTVASWKVEVNKSDGGKLNYWFEKQFPNIMVKFEASDKRSLLLKERTRKAYWVRSSS